MDAYQKGIQAARKLVRYHTYKRSRYLRLLETRKGPLAAWFCHCFAAKHNDLILRYANHVRHIEGLWRRPKLLRRQAL